MMRGRVSLHISGYKQNEFTLLGAIFFTFYYQGAEADIPLVEQFTGVGIKVSVML